jgi:S-adenosylmethionine/arginine decarboxylase-like enzyme
MKYWGLHYIANVYKCNIGLISNPSHVSTFCNNLVKRIDMKAYGSPQVLRFGEGNKYGITLLQPIETSSITAHFCEEDGSAYIDVFSCKEFDSHDVNDIIKEYFKPEHIDFTMLERLAKKPELK